MTLNKPLMRRERPLLQPSGQYHYVWKTETWAGTSRQLVVQLIDGTTHHANFRFK